ncbi:MAG: cytochrome c [Acidobacteriota bacterium]|nr:cytochrome c [Acidobacteriota bacterium]
MNFSSKRRNRESGRGGDRKAAKAVVVLALGLSAAGIASSLPRGSAAGPPQAAASGPSQSPALGSPGGASSPQGSEKKDGPTVFHESGCEYCHGVDAGGTERAPDLSTVGKRLTKEQIENQIRNGGKSMPAFGDALEPDQIQVLVQFLHAKKKAAHGKKTGGASPGG